MLRASDESKVDMAVSECFKNIDKVLRLLSHPPQVSKAHDEGSIRTF